MKNKILIFGKGFIGNRLQEALSCAISAKKLYSLKDAQGEIKKYSPKIIINCIGHTGPRSVDDCELEKDKTLFANTFVPILLAEIALRFKIKLVHISSGCIYHYDYSKDNPIQEDRVPDFFDLYYSRTKIYAERALQVLFNPSQKSPGFSPRDECNIVFSAREGASAFRPGGSTNANILIIRIRIPLDNRPHQRNILTKLINYRKVIDLPNSITYVPDFINALRHLIKIDARGIYNVVNKGSLKYSELLEVYKKYDPDFEYKVIDFNRLNLVRTNLILSTKELEKSGFKIRPVDEVLEECVKNYVKYL